MIGIGGTKRTYEALAIDACSPPRAELRDTLKLMDDVYGEALRWCLRTLAPLKTDAEFQKIVEENADLEAILSGVQSDA